jgi:hypothetical protein
MALDTDKASSNLVNKGSLEIDLCQEECDKDPLQCFAYQIDSTLEATNKCVIFNEKEDLVGDDSEGSICYLYRKTP